MPLLSVVGLSYKTAPAEVRERFAFAETEIIPAVGALRTIGGTDECLLVSTCNRTEVYLVTPAEPPVPQVLEHLDAAHTRGVSTDVPPVYIHRGVEAARHVLRVTAGLDSMVLGEGQILGQIRRAFEIARTAQTTGPVLNRLMQVALSAGRRVRRETGLARSAPSVPRAAVGLCREVLGSVRGRRLLVVGAGDIAALVVKEFGAAGAMLIAVANRTLETGRSLAALVGADAISLDDVRRVSGEADIIVACAAVTKPILVPEMLQRVHDPRLPLLVIDLGIPRCVDATVASLPGVHLYDLDALSPTGASPLSADDLAKAERIVEEALVAFEQWLASRAAAPLLRALQGQVETIVDRELVRLRALDARQQEAVRGVIEAALHRFLHGPITRLREAAIRHDQTTLEVAKALFDVGPKRPGSGGTR